MAAGLAGGSSDAAATLAGLNVLWELGLPVPQLENLATQLGSDVAFFFCTPAAWCTGRGEIVTPVPCPRRLWLVLACPPFGLATADVYRQVVVPGQPVPGDAICQALTAGDVEALGGRLHNRLQEAAVMLRPEIAPALEKLEALGPAGVCMSGSGSTLLAVCRDHQEAQRIAQELRRESDTRLVTRVYLVRSCS